MSLKEDWDWARAFAIAAGATLRAVRTKEGVALPDLGSELGHGLDAPSLSRIERGVSIPDPAQAEVIAEWALQRCPELPQPVARPSDPDTSHEAAESVTEYTVTNTRRFILHYLARFRGQDLEQLDIDSMPVGYWVTDEGMHEWWRTTKDEYVSESGMRTRRNECVKMGWVRDSGQRFQISTGRNAIAWELTEAGVQALKEL